MTRQLKVVVTGGPGGGKTTALDLFRRELSHQIAIVPEAATLLFSSGVSRSNEPPVLKEIQKTIFALQKNLEAIQQRAHPDRLLVCDRGSLDGLAYWPEEESEFFQAVGSSLEQEFGQYDAVIFFESAATTGQDISSNNPTRNESTEQAAALDNRLQAVWSKHPNYHFVPNSESFLRKILFGIMTIENVINQHHRRDSDQSR
ncbi:AAA family ATPase [Ferrimonas sp.]|uniref:AAA family ATPase n=1 Tax=Ferrimonas sp. TaxID=2080861 RepID=UPI003A929621